jgi:hypothetical protein
MKQNRIPVLADQRGPNESIEDEYSGMGRGSDGTLGMKHDVEVTTVQCYELVGTL